MTLDDFNEVRACPGGTLLKDGDSRYWIIVEENDFRHISSGTVMNLFNGELRDCSWLKMPVKTISHNEIMW